VSAAAEPGVFAGFADLLRCGPLATTAAPLPAESGGVHQMTDLSSLAELAKTVTPTPTPKPRRQDGDADAPLCFIVSPSVHAGGRLEIRNNGMPSDAIRDAYKGAGLRWDRTGKAWYGEAAKVQEALEALIASETTTEDLVIAKADPAEAIALWSEMPQARKPGRKAPAKSKAEPTMVDTIKEAQALAAMTGKPVADAVRAMAAANDWTKARTDAVLSMVV
jgi:hypothetical protein